MNKLCTITLFLAMSLGCSHSQSRSSLDPGDKVVDCRSSREYITSIEYLRDRSEKLGLKEAQIRAIADEVSKSCSGAAKRFISAFNLLTNANVDSKSSMRLALQLSALSDQYTYSFLEVFKHAYLERHLDLDIQSSLKIAVALSTEFNGDPKVAAKDFIRIAKFCTTNKHTQLPVGKCAKLSSRVVKKSENAKLPVAKSFIKAFEFIKNEPTLALSTGAALSLAESIVEKSPKGTDNFISAYKYATSEKGLGLTAKQALNFSDQLVSRTVYEMPKRLPASRTQKK